MKIKKLLLLIMSLILSLSAFGGCGKKDNGNVPPPPPVPPEEEVPEETGNYFIKDGTANYRILISSTPAPAEMTAAYELVKYFEKVTGIVMEVIDDAAALSSNDRFISIGENKLSLAAVPQYKNLKTDGFIVKLIGKNMFIIGSNERGTLYGAYEFLESETGIRFLSNTYEHIPALNEVPVRKVDILEEPDVEVRTHYYHPTSHNAYLNAKMRFLSHYNQLNSMSIGGSFSTTWNATVHSFELLVPHAQYYSAHKDWFSSGSQYNQPCFSSGLNDDGTAAEGDTYLNKIIEVVKKNIQDNPSLEWIMLGQNDGGGGTCCTCKRCTDQLKLFDGKRSGQIVAFVNAVAKKIKGWMAEQNIERDINFVTLSYEWSLPAPVKEAGGRTVAVNPLAVPRDDVYIMFASLQACYNHALNDKNCQRNADPTVNSFEAWRQITNRFFVFDYNVNFSAFLSWYPSINVLKNNLQYYKEIGVKGIIAEGALQAQNYYQQDLVSWLLSKLFWNCEQDVNKLISEYNKYYFGEAAGKVMDSYVGFMNTYFENVSRTASNETLHATVYSSTAPWLTSADTLTGQFLDTAHTYIKTVRDIYDADATLDVKQKETYLRNISQAEVQILYMMYRNYDTAMYTTNEEKFRFMTEFFEMCLKLDVQRFNEGGKFVSDIKTAEGY